MPKLTKRVVDRVAPNPAGSRIYVWDTEIRGFGIVVLPTGVKSYIYQYRTAEGRSRRATIGKHGNFTAEEARAAAEEMRRSLRSGMDPLAERTRRRSVPNVSAMLDAYLASARFRSKAPSTQAIDWGRINRHLRPLLGQRTLPSVTSEDVERIFAAIRDGKTASDVKTGPRGRARVTGGDGTARAAIKLLRAIFSWAESEQLVDRNPCQNVRVGVDGTRDAILSDASDYTRLFKTLETLESRKRIRQPVADAIRVIALTGARRGEIAGLRWEHVDLKRGLITLPPKSHKTGKRTGKPRVIGLPSAAQTIIARQPTGAPGAYVFLPARGEGPIELSKPWRTIRVEAGLPAGIGLHGLRHSLASHMAMNGAGAAEIMTALGHNQLSTVQRYVHWAQDARQELAERAASVVVGGLEAASDGGAGGTEIRDLTRGDQ